MREAPDFEAMYRRDPDPFGVQSSWYEQRKLAVVLASLCRQRYSCAWDAACGTGDLALRLASRCTDVLATDDSPRAVELSTARTEGTCVRVRRHTLPDRPHPGLESIDLVVLSEVLYYLPEEARVATYALVDDVRAGEVVAVNWRHHPHDAHLSGTAAVREFDDAFAGRGWNPAVRHEDRDFVLTSWTRHAPEQETA